MSHRCDSLTSRAHTAETPLAVPPYLAFSCDTLLRQSHAAETLLAVPPYGSMVALNRRGGWRGPIDWIRASRHVVHEAGMWPIGGAWRPAVLHRVVVDVIHASMEIRIIADLVFPIPPLPDATLPARDAYG